MRDQLHRWRIPIAIVLVFTLIGIIHYTSKIRSEISFIESAWRDILSPFQSGFTRVQRGFGHKIDFLRNIRTLDEKNKELESLVQELKSEILLLRNYERENEWLREALDLKSELPHEFFVAEVIGRSPSNWEKTITLNRGKAHGVTSGMAVVTNAGVVGTVINSSQFTSTVLLMIDAQSATGGLIQGTGDLVLIEGDQSNEGCLLVTPTSRDTVVEIGDIIVTSGLSRIYPKNLPIGKITHVEPKQFDLSFEAILEPFVDFTKLEYVLVVLPRN